MFLLNINRGLLLPSLLLHGVLHVFSVFSSIILIRICFCQTHRLSLKTNGWLTSDETIWNQ